MDRDTAIVDTPGFQSFGLFHLTEAQIAEAIPEFRPFLGQCKFNDCSHPLGAGLRRHRGGRARRDFRRAPSRSSRC